MSMLNPKDSKEEDLQTISHNHSSHQKPIHRTHKEIPMDFLHIQQPLMTSLESKNDFFITYSQPQREQAQLFFQTVSAYPNSFFTLEFVHILQDILKGCASPDSLAHRFNAYTRRLVGFSFLDLFLISSLFSYSKKQIDLWADQNSRCTYYLYSPCIQQDSKNQYPPHLLGTVELVKSTDSEEYKITFYAKKGGAIPLYYDQGQLCTKEPISLCLQPIFSPKSHWTNNPQDHDAIPLLVGEIHGKKVLGTLTEQDLFSEPGSVSSWYALWYPMHFLQWIHLLMHRIAIMSSLDILLKGAVFVSQKLDPKTTPSFLTEQVYQEAKSVLYVLHKQAQNEQVQIKIPETSQIESEISHQRISLATLLAFQEGLIQKDQLEKQAKQLEQQIKAELSAEKEEIVDVLSSSIQEILQVVSQAFLSHPIEGFPKDGLERALQKNKQGMEEVYQQLSRIHVDLLTNLTEKKEVS